MTVLIGEWSSQSMFEKLAVLIGLTSLLEIRYSQASQTYRITICILRRIPGDVHEHENLRITGPAYNLKHFPIAIFKALEGSLPTKVWERKGKKESSLE